MPIAFVAKDCDTNVQAGVVSSAWSVRQIPPPAAATQRRQNEVLQPGASTRASTGPPVTLSAPLKASRPDSNAILGPASCQFRNGLAGLRAVVFSKFTANS